MVHPEPSSDDISDRTELFRPTFDPNVFDQKTTVSKHSEEIPEKRSSNPLDEETVQKPRANKKSDPARIVEPTEPVEEDSVDSQSEFGRAESAVSRSSSDEASGHDEEIKPFGEATLFEIQKSIKKRGNWKNPALVVLAATVFLSLAYWLYQRQPDPSEREASRPRTPSITRIEFVRPAGWYDDLPQTYQETLAQIATLPKSDQERPETRALLSEALILNGLITGATDQVNRGLSFTPSLVITYPNAAFSYYGTAAYALWFNDATTLGDLYDRWPQANREDREFLLVEVFHLAREGNTQAAFEKAKSLTTSHPDFQRANNFVYLMVLQNPRAAEAYFTETDRASLARAYERHRDELRTQLQQLPKLHTEIERYLGRSAPARQAPPTQPAPSPPPSPQRSAPPEPSAEERSPTIKTDVQVPHNVQSDPSQAQAPAARSRSGLPRASAGLVAQDQAARQSRTQAQRSLSQGNDLLKNGDADGALRAYREALRLDPELADVYKQIGMIYMERKESERALRSFKIYLQLKPETNDKQLVEGWISSLE